MTEQGLSEEPVYEETQATVAGFPPYPPYATEPAPPSVADTIIAGRDLRIQHKSTPRKSVRLPPRPAKPKGPKATDVKLSKRAARAHARCLRRYGAVLTDRLEYMSKPPRRSIIYLWREYAHTLPAETIARLRTMLDADEPFKPDQAYEYFTNLRKNKSRSAKKRGMKQIKKDLLALSGDKRLEWARNATIAFARGIQQRLSRPASYVLADGMLRLSNIILEDLCGYTHMKIPSRCCTHPKAKFMMEMSDKVAVWIDEILADSDDRMLMMDFDEDDDVEKSIASTSEAGYAKSTDTSGTPATTPKTTKTSMPKEKKICNNFLIQNKATNYFAITGADELGDATFTDSFLNMMGDTSGRLLKGSQPAYLKFSGEMLKAFTILTDSMYKKKDVQLLSHGKYNQTYTEAANALKETPDLNAREFNTSLANRLKRDLTAVVKPNTPNNIASFMKDMVEICSKYLAQHAEFNSKAGKQGVLANLAARKENEILGNEGTANLTYTKGGTKITNALDGVIESEDNTKNQLLEKLNAVKPEKNLQDLLKGEASQGIYDETKKEKGKDFISANTFSKTNKEAAKTETSPHYDGQHPSAGSVDKGAEQVKTLSTSSVAGGIDGKTTSDKSDVSGVDVPKKISKDREQKEEEERRKIKDAERGKRLKTEQRGSANEDVDPDREKALQILHSQLRARSAEVFYEQPHAKLTHAEASQWLSAEPSLKVDKSVKECSDTARLHKKFERKLNHVVSASTPVHMYDTMLDVIIESSRILSEYFVLKSFKVLAKVALISEMQKRGNEIMIEVDGAVETFFFAAQRLKKSISLENDQPCSEVSYRLTKKLEDIMKCRSMPRKLTSSMKDHIEDASVYLSVHVTKPDEQIEAYVHLLSEMEVAGDSLLIEGNIPKTFKEAATFLRQLTTFQDLISLPNSSLQTSIEGKLKSIMANVKSSTYSKTVMDDVIRESTKLLVSYVMLQGIKTEALNVLIEQMDIEGDKVLLRHGNIRRTFGDGADALRTKNSDQLSITNADPVVTRKIQIKLRNLMQSCTPDKYTSLMDDVIEDATMYLAVHFLQPHVIQVCKCMKNVFVQCEQIAKPCCNCSRHISTQALGDLRPGTSQAYTHGLEISITPCPSKQNKILTNQGEKPYAQLCPAKKPADQCQRTTTSYLLYCSEYQKKVPFQTTSLTQGLLKNSPFHSPKQTATFEETTTDNSMQYKEQQEILDPVVRDKKQEIVTSSGSFQTSKSDSLESSNPAEHSFWHSPTTMYATVQLKEKQTMKTKPEQSTSHTTKSWDSNLPQRMTLAKRGHRTRAPIITTDQMADWHAMIVSLTWNIQAWRGWIQENIDRALNFESKGETEETWISFHRQTSTEALQWRHYNNFSQQLMYRLTLRYRDKKIVSPTRATPKTDVYMKYQEEMLDIIDMFHRWTRWLSVVMKETDAIVPEADTSENSPWRQLKKKVEEYVEDWKRYNMHLKVCWEQKYQMLITDCLPDLSQSGAVWVVSACGAVPSGAVAAGVYEGEVIWVARTTHRNTVLPGALHPSKHCCVVYSDDGVHHYTKYQVMCNAEVSWVACRAAAAGGVAGTGGTGVAAGGAGVAAGGAGVAARGAGVAARAARGVLVGRVLVRGAHLVGAVRAPDYRCHVVIFGRPVAFDCYELLVLSSDR